MGLLAGFVGIDKFEDPNIPDLTGAQRDARALWALFSDTFPDLKSTLVTDSQATTAAVRQVLDDTLGAAGPEDTAIFFFAGHGTHDHRLVTHDTSVGMLSATTISMDEIAKRFRESPAKIILCILDCCFSGGAPARVLENSPIPRGTTTLEQVAGNGRILIAAANIDEAAYEHPTDGHGLLTKALISVFQSRLSPISLPSAMGEIMDCVRAEATRMGVVQTPVLFGQIEGGLTFPSLVPGQHFFAAFPELQGIRVSSDISQLAQFGLPEPVLLAWAERFQGGLNELQLKAVNDFRILDGQSLLVVAPTSSGKTFIGEMAATKAMLAGRKTVFLFPYRALTSEKYDQFSQLYGDNLGMRVIRCTGDYVDQTNSFIRGKYELALLTYEMFLNLAVSTPSVLNQIGLVVVDEAQFISDPMRGIVVELLLTLLLAARERGINPQLIALSAVIGGVNDFDAWLGCQKLVTTERPVPLVEGVLDRSGVFQFRDSKGNIKTEQLLPPYAIQMRRDKPSAQDVIVPLVRKLVEQDEKVIVFRNQRGAAQGCAKYLSDDLRLPAAQEAIAELLGLDLSSTSSTLRLCLAGGTAFHNTNLSREEKAVVEQAFRDPKSKVRVLAATTTVAAGINTPASTVILAEQEFIGEDGRPFSVAEYKNMAGRAGRLGFNEQGKAIILSDNSYEREQLFNRYVTGKLEDITSSFEPERLDTWVVRLLTQIRRVPRQDLVRLLANTYGGYLAIRNNPNWQSGMAPQLEDLVVRMLKLNLIEEEGEFVQLSLLGIACGRSALSFESCMRLVEILRSVPADSLTAEQLMALVQSLRESDNGYTPMMKRGRSEAVRPREAAERFGPEIVRALQRFAGEEIEYFARCKRAAILRDWIQGIPIEVIEKRYSPNPFQGTIGYGDIRKFADATRFHLRSAHQIMMVMLIDKGPSAESVETLLKQLETGVPASALDLLSLPLSMSRGEYLALYQAGITTVSDLWARPPDSLAPIVGASRWECLEQFRPTKN